MSDLTPDPPPPNYAPSQPQILVAPLPDATSFFWGRTVQGEVFVKGLGQARTVSRLAVQLNLSNTLPDRPPIHIHIFPSQTLYPSSQSTSSTRDVPFPTASRFSIFLPPESPLPGTLNLASSSRGEIRWYLTVTLSLLSGQNLEEIVQVEGTPQDAAGSNADVATEVEEVVERDGVRARVLLDAERPRLGALLRLGVEIRAMERQKTGVAGLSTQPNPAQTLRPLRRVRVELFRRVRIMTLSSTASSSTSPAPDEGKQHLTVLYASGKSLRYPGMSPVHPPLRVLFTIPTIQLGSVADQSWGEITMRVPYHDVQFFVRVSIGFEGSGSDWELEKPIEVRPKIWREPRQVVIQRGQQPVLGDGDTIPEDSNPLTDEEMAREAYRLKGQDTVGTDGTIRMESHTPGEDLPPTFEGAGPSRGGLPTFLESEAQMRTGEAPLPTEAVTSERLIPVVFEEGEGQVEEVDRTTTVKRRGSLGGELGTWVEYDGYETFSVQPPPVGVSFGVGGSMDPPQEGDDDHANVPGAIRGMVEQLGLGEGTRVVDLQDDLPPGIDEPSLPALPDFSPHPHPTRFRSPSLPRPAPPPLEHGPPSFDASEAAQAAGGVAVSAVREPGAGGIGVGEVVGDAPPGYFGGISPAGERQGGPPAYS